MEKPRLIYNRVYQIRTQGFHHSVQGGGMCWKAELSTCLLTTMTYPVHLQWAGWEESESNRLVSLSSQESAKP